MRILIADDHELFCDGLRLVLADLRPEGGADVDIRRAGSYDEALAAVVQAHTDGAPINVVLLDLVMPGMAWTDGLDAITRTSPETAVIILSASDERRLVLETVRRGAKGFIPKTSSSRLMLSALRLVLSGGVYLPPAVLDAGPEAAVGLDVDPLSELVRMGHGHDYGHGHAPAPAPPSENSELGGGGVPAATTAEAETIPLTPRQREVLVLLGHGKSNKEIARILNLSEGTVKLHVTAILKALNVTNRTGAVVAANRLGLNTLPS